MSASKGWRREQDCYGIDLRGSEGIDRCPRVSTTDEVAAVFHDMAFLNEQVWIAGTIDANFRLVYWQILGKGHRPTIAPINVFSGIVLTGGMGAFLVRNSPARPTSRSGEQYDRKLLGTLCHAGTLLGYTLLDYVIVTKNSCHSIIGETMEGNGSMKFGRKAKPFISSERFLNAV